MIELIFAMAIGLACLLFIGGQMGFVGNKMAELDKVADSASMSDFGIRFSSVVEYGDPSANFVHLPIPTGCSASSPCLRKLNSDGTSFAAAGGDFLNPDGVGSVEFFRDSSGVLLSTIPMDTKSHTAKLTANKSLNLAKQSIPVFATWPLSDENSTPFPVMHRQGLAIYFSMDEAYATSAPTADYVVVEAFGASNNQEVLRMKGMLTVIFNSFETRHYAVQEINDILDCSVSSACSAFVPSAPASWSNKFALKLTLPNLSKLNQLAPSLSWDSSSWTGSSFKLFQTGNGSASGAPDLDTAFDIRKASHFNHTETLPGKFIVTPIHLTAYKLKVWKTTATGKIYQLISNNYLSSNPVVEVDTITGPVMFARQLGARNIEMYAE